MRDVVQFKRGASFAPRIVYEPPEGALPSLSGATITSSIAWSAPPRTRVNLTVLEVEEDFMAFTLGAGNTSAWPIGLASWDIKFSIGGAIFYSETVTFEVIGAITS